MASDGIVQELLSALSYSVATRELDQHMEHYSRQVRITGLPGGKVLSYRDVATRRKTEFKKGLLERLIFRDPRVLTGTSDTLTYRVQEIMRGINHRALVLQKKVILSLEEDGKWRIRSEHIESAEVQKNSSHQD
jgi:hypothetical protein